jgi:Ca-activated chloride channel homolog
LTRDAGIIDTFAAALDPKIMPDDGDVAADALALANEVLTKSGQSGSILLIADGITPDQQSPLTEFRKHSRVQIRVLSPLLAGPELVSLEKMTGAIDARVLRITSDDADIHDLARAAKFVSGVGKGQGDSWQDAGYWLIPLIALLSTLWFRRGWMVSTSAMS